LEHIVHKLQKLLPAITFVDGDRLQWSPEHQIITYKSDKSDPENLWGLLHECGHAMLGHVSYETDMGLLEIEVAAWHKAEQIALQLNESVDPEHIQDCLDTYRDWLHQRSTCPRCGIVTFQQDSKTYQCYNCNKSWIVSSSRFCRPYRRGTDKLKNRPEIKSQTVFN
jgi:hypothetical protein